MSRQDDIKQQLTALNRRLQNLEIEKSRKGYDTPSQTLTEIEDIKAEKLNLETELAAIKDKEVEAARVLSELEQLNPGGTRPTPIPPTFPSPEPERKKSYKLSPQSLGLVILGGVLGGVLVSVIWSFAPTLTSTPIITPTAMQVAPPPSQTSTVSVETLPDVSLISMSYMVNKFDPRRVDLRSAADDGIPVRPGEALQFFDLWISVSDEAPDYGIQAEVYTADSDIYLGKTAFISHMSAGYFPLGNVNVENFPHGQFPTSWTLQDGWENLIVKLVAYQEPGQGIVLSSSRIHLDPNGAAWFVAPPNLNFVSLVYKINDGDPLVLDLRHATTSGLLAESGDTLTLLEIWYRSNADSSNTLRVEAFLSSGNFNSEDYQQTPDNVIRKGIHKLSEFEPLSWVTPEGNQHLVLWLVRNAMVLDELKIPFELTATSGLISANVAVHWPLDQVEYIDFESPDELAE